MVQFIPLSSEGTPLESFKLLREFRLKEGLPSFSSDEVILERISSQISDKTFYVIGEEAEIRQGLHEVADILREDGWPITPASISSKFCLDTADNLQRSGLGLLLSSHSNPETRTVNKAVGIGMIDIAKSFSHIMAVVLSSHKRVNVSVTDEIVLTQLRQDKELLRHDPTGLTLVDSQMAGFALAASTPHFNGPVEPFEVPAFILNGTKLAKAAYLKVLPLATKVAA